MSLVTKNIATALLVLGLGLAGVHLANQPSAANGAFDHYKFYRLEQAVSITDPIGLKDQFGELIVDFRYILLDLGVPTAKEGGSIYKPDLHYSYYLFQDVLPSLDEDIVATHQFGEVALKVQNPVALFTPAQKNVPPPFQLAPANHFLCYRALGPPLGKEVSLVNQFGTEALGLASLVMFCAPAEKNHSGVTYPIIDPDQHLTCYAFDRQDPATNFATIVDQFTFSTASLGFAETFCLPSTKNIPTPTEDSSWGRVKTIYR